MIEALMEAPLWIKIMLLAGAVLFTWGMANDVIYEGLFDGEDWAKLIGWLIFGPIVGAAIMFVILLIGTIVFTILGFLFIEIPAEIWNSVFGTTIAMEAM